LGNLPVWRNNIFIITLRASDSGGFMLFNNDNIIVVFCPECGEAGVKEVYLFDFYKLKGKSIICPRCKSVAAEIIAEDLKKYKLRFLCVKCGGIHEIYIKPASFWSEEPFVYRCPKTSDVVAVTGQKEKVYEILAENAPQDEDSKVMNLDNLLDDIGENPEVLAEMVNVIRKMFRDGTISCKCGNSDIGVTFEPGSIKLVCTQCGASKILVVRKTHLAKLKKLKNIVIE
jgi:Zn finger protein HypA/HybF involved in hydrogenase expression